MRVRISLLAALLLATATLSAQTYHPKHIQLQGADSLDKAEILRTLGLKEGEPVSKSEIETALQRLADSGSFTDVSYTVNDTVLTVIVKPAAGAQALPVRFVNFVWWQPHELESLLEQHVPRFHGTLPLSGSMTDEVLAALRAMLAEKGVPDAKVTTALSMKEGGGNGIETIALAVTSPSVTIGEVKTLGAASIVREKLDVLASKVAGQEFDALESAISLRNEIGDVHKNAGYLDATVDTPEFSAPKKDMLNYEVDASVLVHPGEMYHVASLDLNTPAPVTSDEAARVTGLYTGQAAGAADLRVATGSLARAYAGHGFLEAHVQAAVDRNTANHTVAYRFSVDPGQLNHVTSVNGSALTPEQREAFAAQFRGKPGAPADAAFLQEIFRVLGVMRAEKSIHISQRLNRQTHTVEILLEPKQVP